jgi:hypothetical protein
MYSEKSCARIVFVGFGIDAIFLIVVDNLTGII